MGKVRKIPLRKSVVSGEIIEANGRGAYIKLDNLEAAQAKKKQVFNRAFGMEVPSEFYDELIAYVDHKVKRRELGLE